jgi:hypothetical protein
LKEGHGEKRLGVGKLLACSERWKVVCTGLNWPETAVGTEELEEGIEVV